MTYEQALAFWFDRVNFEHSSARPIDFKLERVRALLGLLGDPQKSFRVVHVAGSKGKGSTSAMLAAVLRRAGYRTGLFTSPHLCRPEERIDVDGQPIAPADFCAGMTEIANVSTHPSAGTLATDLTFFEIATALGFLHFARQRVDIGVIEVGLGGRFDSTNVCQPLVSVITSISFDHTQLLGDRLASIAREKAGIIKSGRPVVSGVTAAEARQVIEETCRERGAALTAIATNFDYRHEPGLVSALPPKAPRVYLRTKDRDWPPLELGLLGEHQAANAAVAIATIEQLRREGLTIDDEAVAHGLKEVYWPARLEIVGRRPLVVLDCAHNVASAQALVVALLTSFPPCRRFLVFAGSKDKDLAGILDQLAPHFEHIFLTQYRQSARAASPEELRALLPPAALTSIHATSEQAWRAARAVAGPDDLICITGSVFLAGELRPTLIGPGA